MQKVLALPHTDRADTDPWWDYYRWQNQRADDLFATLYAGLRGEPESRSVAGRGLR
jgi:hypothetical protein